VLTYLLRASIIAQAETLIQALPSFRMTDGRRYLEVGRETTFPVDDASSHGCGCDGKFRESPFGRERERERDKKIAARTLAGVSIFIRSVRYYEKHERSLEIADKSFTCPPTIEPHARYAT